MLRRKSYESAREEALNLEIRPDPHRPHQETMYSEGILTLGAFSFLQFLLMSVTLPWIFLSSCKND